MHRFMLYYFQGDAGPTGTIGPPGEDAEKVRQKYHLSWGKLAKRWVVKVSNYCSQVIIMDFRLQIILKLLWIIFDRKFQTHSGEYSYRKIILDTVLEIIRTLFLRLFVKLLLICCIIWRIEILFGRLLWNISGWRWISGRSRHKRRIRGNGEWWNFFMYKYIFI